MNKQYYIVDMDGNYCNLNEDQELVPAPKGGRIDVFSFGGVEKKRGSTHKFKFDIYHVEMVKIKRLLDGSVDQ